jgi:subtilase family serine protease
LVVLWIFNFLFWWFLFSMFCLFIQALAPNADTFFYSFSDLNPYDSNNEGFLAYLTYVSEQEYPPLVHSLSYGDQESGVFNASNPGSSAYGDSCNEQFMMMGLRGLTLLFSSGDDGVGGYLIRDDPVAACQQALPSWPAASPYVTAVGGTMLTDKYLPVCGEQYAVSGAYPGLPLSDQLTFMCTGTAETVCTSTFGGVITSGGGFSDVSNRSALAPWQEEAVAKYLAAGNAANYPPKSYFNPYGRGYPDVATYASNYFVYLGGRLTRYGIRLMHTPL